MNKSYEQWSNERGSRIIRVSNAITRLLFRKVLKSVAIWDSVPHKEWENKESRSDYYKTTPPDRFAWYWEDAK